MHLVQTDIEVLPAGGASPQGGPASSSESGKTSASNEGAVPTKVDAPPVPVARAAAAKSAKSTNATRTAPLGATVSAQVDEEAPDAFDMEFLAWVYIAACSLYTLLAAMREQAVPRTEESNDGKLKDSVSTAQSATTVAGFTVTKVPHKDTDGFSARLDFIRLILIWLIIGSQVSTTFEGARGSHILLPSAMKSLVFLSGMFSSNFSYKPFMMTLAGLPCTLLLLSVLSVAVSGVAPSDPGQRVALLEIGRSLADCYLQCMFVWRLTLAPSFRLARHFRIPQIVPFAAVCIASYASCTRVDLPDFFQLRFDLIPVKVIFPWRMIASHAPCFAAGLWFTPEQWSSLMDQRNLTVLALICMALLHASTWLPLQSASAFVTPFSQVVLIFAPTWVIASLFGPLERSAPKAVEHLVSCGRRSHYAFYLSWLLFAVLGSRSGAARLVQGLIPVLYKTSGVAYLTALWLTLVLSCRLSDVLFGSLLNMPVRLAERLGDFAAGNSGAEHKALEALEPIKVYEPEPVYEPSRSKQAMADAMFFVQAAAVTAGG